jgi:hypothetical protein
MFVQVSSSTITRRFGTWREALRAADLAQRYGGRAVSERMRTQPARGITNGQMRAELRRVAGILGTTSLPRRQFDEHATAVKASAVERRSGSRNAGRREAALSPVPLGRRWSDDDYFASPATDLGCTLHVDHKVAKLAAERRTRAISGPFARPVILGRAESSSDAGTGPSHSELTRQPRTNPNGPSRAVGHQPRFPHELTVSRTGPD